MLCPKKLSDNWLTFNRNVKTNLFAKDRFNYEVLCHTDLGRTRGESFDSPATLRKWTDFYVHQHKEVMPHATFKGQTPNEMLFGTGKSIEANLKQARAAARQARIQANRKRTCASCPKKEPDLHKIQIDKP